MAMLVARAAKGRDVENFIDSAGWVEVLRPELAKQRERAVKQLVDVLLSRPESVPDAHAISCGIAGEIAGIDSLIETIDKAVVAGQRAYDKVLNEGYKPNI